MRWFSSQWANQPRHLSLIMTTATKFRLRWAAEHLDASAAAVDTAVLADDVSGTEGEVFPTVNGTNLGSAAHPLKHKDVIELAGVRMEFVNAPAPAKLEESRLIRWDETRWLRRLLPKFVARAKARDCQECLELTAVFSVYAGSPSLARI